jgi:hypothetical protein
VASQAGEWHSPEGDRVLMAKQFLDWDSSQPATLNPELLRAGLGDCGSGAVALGSASGRQALANRHLDGWNRESPLDSPWSAGTVADEVVLLASIGITGDVDWPRCRGWWEKVLPLHRGPGLDGGPVASTGSTGRHTVISGGDFRESQSHRRGSR